MWLQCLPQAGSTLGCAQRLREHLLAQLVCPGRHTITSLLTTNGRQFEDWSAHYQLYSQERVRPQALFSTVRTEIEAFLEPSEPLVVSLDDTILRKTGKKIPGTAYRKDPLGPAFHINLVWAQRMLQLSAAVPGPEGQVRMIPIHYQDASTPRKPRKDAPQTQWEAYKEAMKQVNLNRRAVDSLHTLQTERTGPDGQTPPLHLLVDGSYTNRKVLKNLPPSTVLIGRIRKDAHLNFMPEEHSGRGRKRIYGKEAPTPEELCKDPKRALEGSCRLRCPENAKLSGQNSRAASLASSRQRSEGTLLFERSQCV